MDESEDFWATEISNTPQNDKRYDSGEFLLLILVTIGVVASTRWEAIERVGGSKAWRKAPR
jgi:hypothetical protein